MTLRMIPKLERQRSHATKLKAQQRTHKKQSQVKQYAALSARADLHEFIRQAWAVLEPETEFLDNWHIEVITRHLMNISSGLGTQQGIKRLLINIPPGHMKSLIVNVFWPAWTWLERPWVRWMFASYELGLSTRDSTKCRDLIRSEWYQSLFRPEWRLKADQDVKTYFQNTQSGFRMALSVGGKGTGYRADVVVVDDPHNVKKSESAANREDVKDWWGKTMSSRLTNARTGARVVVMQRLHEDDLSGDVLVKGGYEHICLPSRFEAPGGDEPPRSTVLGVYEHRTLEGEVLFEALFPESVLEQAELDMGSIAMAGQHQQRPTPAAGGTFQRHWWRFWIPHERPDLLEVPVRVKVDDEWRECPLERLPLTLEELREKAYFDEQFQSWDMAFKDTKTSAYVVGQLWARKGSRAYLLDQTRDRLNLPRTLSAVRDLSERWPLGIGKLIEDKANGPAVMQTLEGEVGGLLPVQPYGTKEARGDAVSPLVEAGDVYLPHPALFSWMNPLLERLTAFPNTKYVDEVDTLTQGLHRIATRRKLKTTVRRPIVLPDLEGATRTNPFRI